MGVAGLKDALARSEPLVEVTTQFRACVGAAVIRSDGTKYGSPAASATRAAAWLLHYALLGSEAAKADRVWRTRTGARKPAQESAAASEYSDVPSPMGDATMLEIFSANPWLVAVAMVAFVSLVCVCVGIVCISVNVCRRKIRLAWFDFELKRDMLQRGFSAEEIRIVIEAGRPGVPDHDPRPYSDHRREAQSCTQQ